MISFARSSRLCWLLIVYLFVSAEPSLAVQPKYGPEFEFSNIDLLLKKNGNMSPWHGRLLEKKNAKILADYINQRCPEYDCVMTRVDGKFGKEWRFTFPDGFWFQVSWDPGCVEVIAEPLTVEHWKQKEDLMSELLFESAKGSGVSQSIGIYRHLAGHINQGFVSSYNGDADLFLYDFVDFQNHSELGVGILGKDFFNASPIHYLGEGHKAALEEVVRKQLRSGYLNAHFAAQDINSTVYTLGTSEGHPVEDAPHYQAIGLKSITGYGRSRLRSGKKYEVSPLGEQRTEHRYVRVQKSFQDYLLTIEYFDERLAALRQRLKQGAPRFFLRTPVERFLNKQAMVDLFWAYLQDLGMSFEKYKNLLPDWDEFVFPDQILLRKSEEIDFQDMTVQWKLKFWARVGFANAWVRQKLTDLMATKDTQIPYLRFKVLGEILHFADAQDQTNPEFVAMLDQYVSQIENSTDPKIAGEVYRRFQQQDYMLKGFSGQRAAAYRCRSAFY